jgi:hypothetical protein
MNTPLGQLNWSYRSEKEKFSVPDPEITSPNSCQVLPSNEIRLIIMDVPTNATGRLD